jgi:hypothetical protein
MLFLIVFSVDMKTYEYHLDLIPFDSDVLSMELSAMYKECNLKSDCSSLLYIARALIKLQNLFGIIPIIRGKGALSQVFLSLSLFHCHHIHLLRVNGT